MLKDHTLWHQDSQWLHHPRIMAYIYQMLRKESIDWHTVYSVQEPISPTFFMENYAGPAIPIPPSHLLQVPTVPQSAPPTLPRDRSVQPLREIPEVKPETPAALSVEPPTQVSADLPPPISVDPPIPVLIEPISLDPPAPVSVEPPTTAPASKPKAKRREKKPKAGPSNESASAGKKKERGLQRRRAEEESS
jgi:hypothetical protein